MSREVLEFASSLMAPETSPPQPRLLRHALLVAALYSAAALVYLRPIWTTFRNSLAPNAADPVFSVYILQWVVRQIRLGFPDVWDANFFYPAHGTLALSDHMLGPAFQIAFIHDPIAGYNLLFFSSFVLCGVSTWWVLRHSGLSGPAALSGGAAFAFSPFRMSHLNHLMMLIMQWMPLTLWSWDRLLDERTLRRAALFLLFYGLHLTAGCYFAYMIHSPMAAILGSRWAAAGRRRLLAPDSLRVLAPVAALALAAAVAVFLPYLRLARRLDMTRDDHEIGHRGATLASYVSPAPENLGRRSTPADLPQRAAGATPTARTAPRRTLVAAGAAAWAWIAGLALAVVLAVELAPRPVRWVEVLTEDEFPEVYTWIRGRPEIRALVEVPLRPNWTEATYMYYSTAHWKPIANGYSSFVPDSYDRLAAAVRLLPEGDGLSLLESMGITHVVVHTDLLARRAVAAADAQPQGNAMVREWERRFRGRRVELVFPGDPERVYRIIPMFSAAPPLVLPRRSSPAAAETE